MEPLSKPMRMFVIVSFLQMLVITRCSASSEKLALIIIDVQNCFLPGGTLAVANGNDVIPIINDLRAKHGSYFDLVAQSQDWHCADHVSFASQHPGYSPLDTIQLNYNSEGQLCRNENITGDYAVNCTGNTTPLGQTLWPDHCIINSTDAEFNPELTKLTTDHIVQKGYRCGLDSYSAFFGNGNFGHTELEEILKDADITTVYIVGLARDYCVYWTAKDAKTLGFKTYVVLDATRGVAEESSENAVADMIQKGILVINSTDFLSTVPEVSIATTVTPMSIMWWPMSFYLLLIKLLS